MNVTAVVVTYNRKELLARCLEALAAQTHRIATTIVIDNASTDGTEDVLERFDVQVTRRPENAGSAGGFAEGVIRAGEVGSDWVWLMDDDAEPTAEALETMLATEWAGDPGTGVLCPKVVFADGGSGTMKRFIRQRCCRSIEPSGWTTAEQTAASPSSAAARSIANASCRGSASSSISQTQSRPASMPSRTPSR